MINPYYEEAELLIVYINSYKRFSKEQAKRFIKQMALSAYPDIKAIQKTLRKRVWLWYYFNQPINFIKLNEMALAVCDKAEKSVPKS